MTKTYLPLVASVAAMLTLALGLSAQSPRQMKFNIASGGVVNIVNNGGSVVLRPATDRQVTISSTQHSDKVEIDSNITPDGRRLDIRTHILPQQKPASEDTKVDYEISVPAGVFVTVNTATAPITVDNVSGDLNLSSDTGEITVRNINNSQLHVRAVGAPVNLSNINGEHIEIVSSSGPVQATNVTGPKVTVNSTKGDITYQGDFAGGGDYRLTTHSGAIEVTLPQSASVDLTARSITGSVQDDFHLQQKSHITFVPAQGRSFAGTSNSGSSSVELQSFSGRIRVKKQ